MGSYSHRYHLKRDFTDSEWEVVCLNMISLTKKSSISLSDGSGEPNTLPIIRKDYILFNGVKPYCDEVFFLPKKIPKDVLCKNIGTRFHHCRTNRFEYDSVVLAFFYLCNLQFPDILSIDSDSSAEERILGKRLANFVLNLPI